MERYFKDEFLLKKWEFIEKNISIDKVNESLKYNYRYKNDASVSLFQKFPQYSWDYNLIYRNITLDEIRKIPERQWDYSNLSINPNLTIRFIKFNINKNWNWKLLSQNKIIRGKFVSDNLDKNWDWSFLSKNKGITLNFIESHLDLNWNWKYLSYNPNITEEFICKHLHESWDLEYISKWCSFYFLKMMESQVLSEELSSFANKFLTFNKNIHESLEYFNNIGKVINYRYVSKNPYIDPFFILNNLDLNWDFFSLSLNNCINETLINETINYKWDWRYLSCNESITINILKNNLDKYLGWSDISKNPAITWDNVKNNLDLPWAKTLILNPNISPQIIENNKKIFPWKKKMYLLNSSYLAIEKYIKCESRIFLELLFSKLPINYDVKVIIYEFLAYFPIYHKT